MSLAEILSSRSISVPSDLLRIRLPTRRKDVVLLAAMFSSVKIETIEFDIFQYIILVAETFTCLKDSIHFIHTSPYINLGLSDMVFIAQFVGYIAMPDMYLN